MRTEDVVELAELRRKTKDGTARQIRLAAGLSQPEIAAACGVTHSAISLWETGRRTPRGTKALQYARLLTLLAGQAAKAGAA